MEAVPTGRAQANVRSLLRLAWPLVISRSTQTVVGLADALMVAHLGSAAVAATGTGANNAFVLFILPMGTVFIVGSFASQHFGKGDLAGARRYALYGLGLAIATELLAVISIPAIGPALKVFSFAPDVEPLIRQYLSIRLLSSGAVVGIESLSNYYAGLGNTRVPMAASLAAMALAVIGNWLLIDGQFGLPAMGVAGTAWASVISAGAAFAGLLAYFVWDGRRQRLPRPELRGSELWSMLRFGLPLGFNWFFEFAAFLFFVNIVIAGLGTTALAAWMAVINLNSVAFMPAFALASSGAIIAGQAIGAGAKDEVPRAAYLTLALAAGWQAAVGVVYLVIPRLVISPFARGEGGLELLDMGARMLMLSAGWQLFDATATTFAEALRAAGDTAFTLWARLVLAWLVLVPGSWWSVRHLGGGELVAMLWFVAYLGLLALALWLRFRRGSWRRFQLVGPG